MATNNPETKPIVEDKVFGVDKKKYEAMTYGEQMRTQMLDLTSPLVNQESPELTVTFQLLNNTPFQLIEAMTGKSEDFIAKEAEKLGVTLKVPQAGDLRK